MEEKRSVKRKFLGVVNNKYFMLAITILVFSLVSVLAGDIVFKEGALNVTGNMTVGEGFEVNDFEINSDGFIGHGTDPTSNVRMQSLHTYGSSGVNTALIAKATQNASATQTIGGLTQALATHTGGVVGVLSGYFGGVEVNTNENVTLGVGVQGQTKGTDTKTAKIFALFGGLFEVIAEDLAVTNAISLYVPDPTVQGGSITNKWAGLFTGDVQVSSDKKLILEGGLYDKGDSYMVYNTGGGTIDVYVDGENEMQIGNNLTWFSGNVSFAGMIDRTTAWNSDTDGNALDHIRNDYVDEDGNVNHSLYSPLERARIMRMVKIDEEEANYIPDYCNNIPEGTTLHSECESGVTEMVPIYEEVVEEGTFLSGSIAKHEQAIYELKTELCFYNNYSWC